MCREHERPPILEMHGRPDTTLEGMHAWCSCPIAMHRQGQVNPRPASRPPAITPSRGKIMLLSASLRPLATGVHTHEKPSREHSGQELAAMFKTSTQEIEKNRAIKAMTQCDSSHGMCPGEKGHETVLLRSGSGPINAWTGRSEMGAMSSTECGTGSMAEGYHQHIRRRF